MIALCLAAPVALEGINALNMIRCKKFIMVHQIRGRMGWLQGIRFIV